MYTFTFYLVSVNLILKKQNVRCTNYNYDECSQSTVCLLILNICCYQTEISYQMAVKFLNCLKDLSISLNKFV